MINMTNAIKDTISISLFNKGFAGKIFKQVKESGAKVVMKNNTAECVLMAPDEYLNLMDEVNDARLLTLATQRIATCKREDFISGDEVFKNLGITDDDLANYNEVEFE